MPSTEETLGAHGARLKALEDIVIEIRGDVKTLLAEKNERAGGRKVGYTIAGAVGAITSFVAQAAITKYLK